MFPLATNLTPAAKWGGGRVALPYLKIFRGAYFTFCRQLLCDFVNIPASLVHLSVAVVL